MAIHRPARRGPLNGFSQLQDQPWRNGRNDPYVKLDQYVDEELGSMLTIGENLRSRRLVVYLPKASNIHEIRCASADHQFRLNPVTVKAWSNTFNWRRFHEKIKHPRDLCIRYNEVRRRRYRRHHGVQDKKLPIPSWTLQKWAKRRCQGNKNCTFNMEIIVA